MLRHLTVENYALIERLDMTLSPRLNIITGETGAGKSILLGALGLVLGERADIATLKESGKGCVVEGTFEIGAYRLQGLFEEHDLEYADETIIRRVITPAGKSRAYINDLPVSLAVLKEIGTRLIDIHSQHHSLMIAEESFRMDIVDAVAENGALLEEYATKYDALRSAERQLSDLRAKVEAAMRDKEYVEFQYNQLSALHLKEGELEELESQQRLLDNVERITEALGGGGQMLDEEETGVLARLKTIENSFQKIKDAYAPAEGIAERVRGALVELKDISALLAEGRERVDADPEKARQTVERIDAIYTLMRKHGVQSVEELMAIEREYAEKLGVIVDADESLTRLEAEVEKRRESAVKAALRITTSRTKAAQILSTKTEEMLARLGMEQSRFVCDVTPAEGLTPAGGDHITFRFSSSPKFTPQPVEKVASGGEISRVMLCLKALVADKTQMPTVVFDEIDTGISGRVADVTGQIIAELSLGRQVVNITHLPQVASKGDTHFRVYKQDGNTHIRLLTSEERVEEVAAMLSGTDITASAREQASALLKK
ncbi:MAG: DNA repair protein RecN [Tidjanibacter sp.]|nr:DNA repair protein RecN [Tidjanibacter sp.]